MNVAVLCGGVGAARFLTGLVRAVAPADITAVVNVGDDLEVHGLHVSPDIDTNVYTLAGAIDPERGWGLADETWSAGRGLERYGSPTWFQLGDTDLATHLYRTERLAQGARLSEATAEIAAAWDLEVRILPVTDDRLRTVVTLAASGQRIGFQDYFVRLGHQVEVAEIAFDGAPDARPGPGVLEALAEGPCLIAPSNPLVSIDPILAVPGIRDVLAANRSRTVAVSPLVGGKALKGPADRLMTELGESPTAVGIARHYRDVAGTLVVDAADADWAPAVEAEGMKCIVTETVMTGPAEAAALAQTALEAAR